MKTRDWKDIAEIVGIAAIVASLVFVGLQMRQSHEIALVTLYQMRADAAREVSAIGMENTALYEAYERIDSGGELTPANKNALYGFLDVVFNHFENSHFLYQRGFLTDEHWQSDLTNIKGILSEPEAREIWEELKYTFRQSYVDTVEDALKAL